MKKNILIILLGSHVPNLLNDRVSTAVDFITNKCPTTNVKWYLSGGIAKSGGKVSEADKMKSKIESEINYNPDWSFILDTEATNTAENFIHVMKHLDQETYDDVYVVTSEFHKNRAEKIANKVFVDNDYKWITGQESLPDSLYWEKIHMRNVDNDVQTALEKRKAFSNL